MGEGEEGEEGVRRGVGKRGGRGSEERGAEEGEEVKVIFAMDCFLRCVYLQKLVGIFEVSILL